MNNWKIVERLNFNYALAAWEEHLIQPNATKKEAEKYIGNNPDRVLFAYIPSYFGGMDAIIYNNLYAESIALERKQAKVID